MLHGAREDILDTSATGLLTGSSSAAAYLTYLQKERVNLKKVVVWSHQKRHFHFSDGQVLQCLHRKTCCQFSGRRGELMATVIPGSALLVGQTHHGAAGAGLGLPEESCALAK